MQIAKQEEIYQLLAKVNTQIDPAELKPDQPLSDFGYESLDKIGVLMELEKQYSLSIPDTDSPKLSSVENIISYLNGRLSNT